MSVLAGVTGGSPGVSGVAAAEVACEEEEGLAAGGLTPGGGTAGGIRLRGVEAGGGQMVPAGHM